MNCVRRARAVLLRALGALFIVYGGAEAAVDPLAVVPPTDFGPYPAACSDIAQNTTPAAGNLSDYWEGQPFDGNPHYVTEIMTEPADTPTYKVAVPDDSELYDGQAGQSVTFVALICYPTSAANTRPDYPIPGEVPVPHMQRAGQAPIFADPSARYPVVLLSHGLGGSPLDSAYLQAMEYFASHGYVVIAPFHADARFSRIRVEDFSDLLFLVRNMDKLNAMQAMRPQALHVAIDYLLGSPQYADHVDVNNIGGFGASLGGEAMLLLAGAKLTVSFGLSSKRVITDQRVKAMVGYVPYSGQRLLPAFGDDQNGTIGITVPFMAIGGTADTTAPLFMTEQAVNNMSGTRYVVSLPDVVHGLAEENVPEVFTWSITFLDAHLKDDATRRQMRTLIARMEQVAGGSSEHVDVDVLLPEAPRAGEAFVTEFFNTQLGHYFMTPYVAEANGILAGAAGPGWMRTGLDFNAWMDGAPVGVPLCRFYGKPGRGPNSHFFTSDPAECAAVMRDPGWTFEGLTARVVPTAAGVCPNLKRTVYRQYNNGFVHNDSNHRYTTSRSTRAQMVDQGWADEGTVFCVVP